jgi:hypothetical protein
VKSADPEDRSRATALEGQVLAGIGQATSTPQVRQTVPQHVPPGQLADEQVVLEVQVWVTRSQTWPPPQSAFVAQAAIATQALVAGSQAWPAGQPVVVQSGTGRELVGPSPQAASAAASASVTAEWTKRA